MKFTFENPPRNYSGKGQMRIIPMEIPRGLQVVKLIILVIALAACSSPQQASSGAESSAQATGTPGTPAPPETAGSAILNLKHSLRNEFPNGSDFQEEVGAIPLKFFNTTEGDLIVEGTGKTEWTEIAVFPACNFTAEAVGKVSVTGIFSKTDCLLHLTIATKFSQPTTTNQSGNCTGSIVFSETEFSSRIELDPDIFLYRGTDSDGWWEETFVKLTDLKSTEVEFCFTLEEAN